MAKYLILKLVYFAPVKIPQRSSHGDCSYNSLSFYQSSVLLSIDTNVYLHATKALDRLNLRSIWNTACLLCQCHRATSS